MYFGLNDQPKIQILNELYLPVQCQGCKRLQKKIHQSGRANRNSFFSPVSSITNDSRFSPKIKEGKLLSYCKVHYLFTIWFHFVRYLGKHFSIYY
jgi:hypothetical protein